MPVTTKAVETVCEDCGLVIDNHLDAPSDDQDTPDSECDIHHILHTLVESRTF